MESLLKKARGQAAQRRRQLEFRAAFARFEREWGQSDRRLALRWDDRRQMLGDATATTNFDRHYIYHTAWAARVLAEGAPAVHIDIGSSLYFAAIVSAFIPVEFYDYRPANLELEGLTAGAADLTQLRFADASVASLSCMHTVEHVGLGRYGDALDVDGDRKAMAELQRVIAPGGSLLFVVPVGNPRIIFNAHRIYSHEAVVESFPELELAEFALIPEGADRGHLIRNAEPGLVHDNPYDCGCFHFRRM